MAKNIFIGNLQWEVSNDDLLEMFGKYGRVAHVQIITDKDTGRPRGFGFVLMENDADAARAIAELNGARHKGRALTVNEAGPRGI